MGIENMLKGGKRALESILLGAALTAAVQAAPPSLSRAGYFNPSGQVPQVSQEIPRPDYKHPSLQDPKALQAHLQDWEHHYRSDGRLSQEEREELSRGYVTLSDRAFEESKKHPLGKMAAQYAMRLDPSHPNAYLNLAIGLFREKDFSGAIEIAEKGLKRNPNNEVRLHLLRNLAGAAYRMKDNALANSYSAKGLEIDSGDRALNKIYALTSQKLASLD